MSGSIRVLGDADLELATGITTVASTGFLQIDGNKGTLDIGNNGLGAATNVTAKALRNDGALNLVGSGFLAELIVNGAASTGGNLTIGANSEVDVTGSNSFTQAGGTTTVDSGGSLIAATINANDGLLDFKNTIASGMGALNIGDQGRLEFDSSVAGGQTVNFAANDGTLALGDAGAFSGTIAGFSHADVIDLLGQTITNLAFSGGNLTVDPVERKRGARLQRQLYQCELHLCIGRAWRKQDTPHLAFGRPPERQPENSHERYRRHRLYGGGRTVRLSDRAETIHGYLEGVHLQFLSDPAIRGMASGNPGAPAAIETRFRYNQDFDSIYAMVPGAIALQLALIPAILMDNATIRSHASGVKAKDLTPPA